MPRLQPRPASVKPAPTDAGPYLPPTAEDVAWYRLACLDDEGDPTPLEFLEEIDPDLVDAEAALEVEYWRRRNGAGDMP